jgi:hypothetical protein
MGGFGTQAGQKWFAIDSNFCQGIVFHDKRGVDEGKWGLPSD